MIKNTTTHHDSSDSRARLPILIAVLMLLASMVFMGSALTGTAQAQDEHGAIPSMALASGEPGQLVITWEAPSPAPTDYRIRWANTDLGWPSWSGTNETERANEYPLGGVTTFTLSGLTPGDDYKVQIRSRYYNADRSVHESSGPWTNTATQRVKDHPPAAPTGLAASQVAHDGLTLSWNDPQDDNITGYRILRGPSADSLATIQPNTGSPSTNYTDITVEPETTYHYAVQALSQDGNGARALTSSTTPAEPDDTVQNDPPAVPTGLTASNVQHDSLTLTWDDPEDDGITGYRVLRGPDADSLSTLENDTESVSTEYEDATVQPETTYFYGLLALSQDGNSVQSDAISTTTPAVPSSGEQTDSREAPKKEDPRQRVGARQVTTTDVWTATLTPADIATVWKGCLNNCNNAAILSDDDFTYDSIDYTIVQLTVRNNPSPLLLGLTPQITAADADGLTLVVGSTSFPFANATFAVENSARSVTWSASGLSWTVGTDVAVKITVTNNTPTVENAIPNQTATTGTAFSYRFPDNTFNDTDTGDTLTYTTTKADGAVLPTWLAFDSATRIFSGTPTAAETVSLKVTASDGTASVSDEFDIVVRAADNTAPTVTSIERQDPTALLTNSDTPTWRVTFSEAVKNVDGTDFTIAGTTATPTATPVTLVPGGYDVTPTGGDIASLTGTLTLAFASAQNIADTADNELAATAPTGINEPTFELDNTVPTFVSGTANGTLIVLTFSEELDPNSLPPGEAFDVSALGNFSAPQPVVNSVAIEGTMVTLTVTPALFTDHTVTVNNNAYNDGMGRVPLKDFAGNAVQPAATVGSHSVTNETPIGPPASLRAQAGDGRVRLVWTDPAGVDFQTALYQYRYAAGASVPEETGWSGPTVNIFQTTVLLFGLTNGTPHAFEVRAVRGSEVGATATASATPMAAVCSTPDLGDRREVWSATLTVGGVTGTSQTDAGYRSGRYGSLGQNGDRIIIGDASYTIRDIFTIIGVGGERRRITLTTVNNSRFTPAVGGALRFHWCSDSSGLTIPTTAGYRASNNHEADWSIHTTRELALSLPANNDATGTPDITGRALAGQTLTAGTGNTADADGLPQNASDFAWQWIRAADETDTPIQDATSSTYTLTDDDAGKQVKVVMSFTDSLSGVESLTSDAYPSSSTVQRVLVSNIGQTVITQNNNAGELESLDAAQEFTTGSNETGYTLSSIDLDLTVASTSNFPVVKLFSDSANRTEVATLTAPTNASTGKTTYTFTVPTAITLEGDTSYWVMAETGGGTWHTVGFAEDATPAPDWSIADRDEFRVFSSTGPFTTGTLVALMIRVNGTVNNPFLENFRADAGNAQVTLRWDNPEDSSITRYQYRQRLTSERAWDPDWTDIPGSRASTTSYTVRNLANRAAYTFQIRAVRGNEPTATSTASATPEGPPTAPLAPRNLAARGQDQGITAWWQTPPAGDERAPVTSYKVRYRQVGTSPWQNITRANDDRSATQEINNLTNRQHYQVQVAAVNRMGTGQWASVKATPQAPDSPPPAPTGDATLTLGILGLFWDNSTTGNTLWADTCTGSRSFRIIWDGPKGRARGADEWAAHINTSGGAGVVTYSFREISNHPGYYEMYGTVNFEGNGSLSVNVRGRFGETWGTWSPTGSLYCYTTERPSRN